MDRRWKN